MSVDIRWIQRLQNFRHSLSYLDIALAIKKPDIVHKAGIMQFFEITFELAWKVLKDFLEEEGFTLEKTPRSVLKKAFEINLIEDGSVWLNGLEDRNLSAHIYDEVVANQIIKKIREVYAPQFHLLEKVLQQHENIGEHIDRVGIIIYEV